MKKVVALVAALVMALSLVMVASAEDLLKIEGIGPGKASTLMAAVELGKRIAASRQSSKYARSIEQLCW